MTNKQLVGEGKRLYSSPLSEEFFVSFEENILSVGNDGAGTTKSYIMDPSTGSGGMAGSGDLDGGSTGLL